MSQVCDSSPKVTTISAARKIYRLSGLERRCHAYRETFDRSSEHGTRRPNLHISRSPKHSNALISSWKQNKVYFGRDKKGRLRFVDIRFHLASNAAAARILNVDLVRGVGYHSQLSRNLPESTLLSAARKKK